MKERTAQGTIEYLVIIAVVVVVALVVVGLLISLSSPGAQVSQNTGKLNAAAQPVSVLQALAGADGNGVLTIKNNTGDGITITKITIGDSNQDISAYFAQGDSRSIQLNQLSSCTPGTTKTYSIKINYTSSTGLAKTQTVDNFSINCETTAITQNPINLLPDNAPPTITLTSPSLGYNTPLTQIDFNFIVTDQNTIRDCNLIIDSAAAGVNVSAPTRGINITLTKSGLSTGDHTWDVNCTDATGNRGTSGTARSFRITTAPIITLTAPQIGYSTALTQIDFNFKVHGEVSIRDCNLIIDTTAANVNVSAPIIQDTNITLTKAGLTAGAHTWDVNCTDTNNSRGTSGQARTFYIQAPPVVYLSTPLTSVSSTQTGMDFNFSVSDTDGPVNSCSFILDGSINGAPITNPTKDTNLTFTRFGLAVGAHTWDVNCTDANTNIGASNLARPLNMTLTSPPYFAKKIIGSTNIYGSNIKLDSYGNIFAGGILGSGSALFDSIRIDANADGNYGNGFIGKMNSDGNWLWVKKAGTVMRGAGGKTMGLDANENIYIAGGLTGTGNYFGSYRLDANTSLSSSAFDIYVAKLSSDGNTWLWARKAGGMGGDEDVRAMVVDSAGNSYVIGKYRAGSSFDSFYPDANGTTNPEAFVGKMNSDGNWVWVSRLTNGPGQEFGYDIGFSTDGNLFVTGMYDSNTLFGSTRLDINGTSDIFVGKIGLDGNWIWVKKGGGSGTEQYSNLVPASDGSVFVTGYFYGNALLGGYSLDSNATLSSSNSDIFIAKMDSSGNWLWAKKAGGGGSDSCNKLVVDSSNNVYLTGNFNGNNASSGSAFFGSKQLDSNGAYGDIFVAKLDSSGNWLGAKRAGSAPPAANSSDSGASIDVDSRGIPYISGQFFSTSLFDSTSLDANLTYSSAFLWKTDPSSFS